MPEKLLSEKLLFKNYSILPKNLDNLKLELQCRGFDVEIGFEMKKFLFYRKLSKYLYVSTPNAKGELRRHHGLLEVNNYDMTPKEKELILLFFTEYRWITF